MFRQAIWVMVIAIVFYSPAACACSCDRWDVVEQEAQAAPILFKGEVVQTEVLPVEESPLGEPLTIRTTFKIKGALKGNPRDGFQVYSSGYVCGPDFPRRVGQTVVVAAEEKGGKYFVGFCAFYHLNRQDTPERARR
jgi:hypothetical protein